MAHINKKRVRALRHFYISEVFHQKLYATLATREGSRQLRPVLRKLAEEEQGHVEMWRKELEHEGAKASGRPAFLGIRIWLFMIARRILGAAFLIRMLEKDEVEMLGEYEDSLKRTSFDREEAAHISEVIREERVHESGLADRIKNYEGDLNYIRSIVFGLNDGLVEVLAAVAGLAVLATGPLLVVVGGIIIGVSGTLSMAGGAYLASRSHELVERGMSDGKKEKRDGTTPSKDALYTGVYYFVGALMPIAPFALGLSGFYGILAAILLVVVALTIASVIIALVSYSSVKRRIIEMLAISLGASFATILLGTVMKLEFGISI